MIDVYMAAAAQQEAVGLDRAAIIQQVQNYEPSTTPADPFSAKSKPDSDGTPFRVTFEFEAQTVEYARYKWRYDLDRNALTFSVMPHNFVTTSWEPGFEGRSMYRNGRMGFILSRSEKKDDGGRRSNAYGTTVRVETITTTEIGIAEWSDNYRQPAPFGDRLILERTLTIAPEDARNLTADMHIVVTGVLKTQSGGSPIVCGSDYYEPSIRNPRENIIKTCVASVDIQKISVERKTTGATVISWP